MTATMESSAAANRNGPARTLAGTGALLRFQLRRTRIYLIGWLAGLGGFTWMVAAALPEVYPSPEDRAEMAVTFNTPAMRSMTGPERYFEFYDAGIGPMYAHQMLLWTGAITAVMFILLVSRLTRADEESSRSEVLRSLPVGRRADLAAALLLSIGAAAVLGLVLALATVGMEGVGFGDALLYGLTHSAIGLVFAGVAAVTCQMAGYASTANGMAFAVLGATILMRAVGDVQDNAASWLSPIGWAQLTFVFTGDQRWWPLALSAAAFLLLVWLAFALVAKRDFGGGLMPPRAGSAHASPRLSGVMPFTLRLTRAVRWSGLVTMALLGAAYGSVFGSADDLAEGLSDVQRQILEQAGGAFVDSLIVTISAIAALVAGLFGLLVIGRARKEETAGRGELLAATATPRHSWPGSYLPAALYASSLGAVVGGLFMARVGADSLDDWSYFGTVFIASVQYLPAIWVLVAFAFAGLGWLPKAGWLRWLAWIYAFVVAYLGELLEMPGWARSISPFDHVSNYPVEDVAWAPLVMLTIVAAAFTAIGYAGVRRRDLHFS